MRSFPELKFGTWSTTLFLANIVRICLLLQALAHASENEFTAQRFMIIFFVDDIAYSRTDTSRHCSAVDMADTNRSCSCVELARFMQVRSDTVTVGRSLLSSVVLQE